MICGKVTYKSQSEAAAVLVGTNSDKRPGRKVNRLSTTYFCNDCNGWHIASRCNKRVKRHKHPEDIQSQERQNKKYRNPKAGVLIIRNFTSKPL